MPPAEHHLQGAAAHSVPTPLPVITERSKALRAAAAKGLPDLDQSIWEDVIHSATWEVGASSPDSPPLQGAHNQAHNV